MTGLKEMFTKIYPIIKIFDSCSLNVLRLNVTFLYYFFSESQNESLISYQMMSNSNQSILKKNKRGFESRPKRFKSNTRVFLVNDPRGCVYLTSRVTARLTNNANSFPV